MSALLPLALAVLAAARAPAPLECGELTCRHFDSPKQAFSVVLERKPLVLGLGEYHEVEGAPKVKSAIKRFTEALLPLLKDRATDLIAETWITNGTCGQVEKEATQQIEKESERPATTEDEVVTMLKRANALGVAPHILTVECEDYEDLLDDKKEIDNVKLLEMVTRLLREKAEKLASVNRSLTKIDVAGKGPKAVVIYGGALHNDLSPSEELATFSFAPDLQKATDGRYVQLGLYVPEYIERDEETRKAVWYPFFEKYASSTKTLLITLGPDAHLLIFPRTAKPAAKAPAKR